MASAALPFHELSPLGSGASGRVVLAEFDEPHGSCRVGDRVAVKLVHHGASAEVQRSFELEKRLGQELQHPRLTPVLASGATWFAMPLLEGGRLDERLETGGPLEAGPLARTALGLAQGLAHLHASGWLHGDCKPDNVVCDRDGTPRWIDLGFAQPVAVSLSSGRGSPRWLSPEELMGRPRTPAAEVFTLGMMVYELCTGEHPFLPGGRSAETPLDLAQRMDLGLAVRPSAVATCMESGLEELLEAMLAPTPAQRPSSAEVAERLGALPDHYAQPPGPSPFGPKRPVRFVGRSRELQILQDIWEQTATRGPAAVWISGPEGSGSSRLGDEFARRVRRSEDPAVVLQARPSRLADAPPLQPLLDLVRAWLHTPAGRNPSASAVRRLERWVPHATAGALLAALRVNAHSPGLEEHLVHWLLAATEDRGMVVFLDNADLLGTGSLAVLTRAAAELGSRRLQLICVREPGRVPRDPVAFAQFEGRLQRTLSPTQLPLPPLALAEVLELVERTFALDAPRKRIARALLTRSQGQPGLLSELLDALAAGGHVAPSPRGWTVRRTPEDWPQPASVARLLEQRFAMLPLEDRLWLQRCAVAAQHLTPGFLAQAFGHATTDDTANVLESLCASGWLQRDGRRFRFARGARRVAVLRSTMPARRERLHSKVAAALAAAGAAPFERAFHLRMAGSGRELLELLDQHMSDLRETLPARRVRTLARWGLAVLDAENGPEDSDLEPALLEAAAESAGRLGRREEQREWLDRLAGLDLDEDRRPGLAARVYLLHGMAAAERGTYGIARGMLRNARLVAEKAGDDRTVLEARLARGEVHVACGAIPEAREDLNPVASSSAPEGDAVLRARARLALGLADLLEDNFEEALRSATAAAEELADRQNPRAATAMAEAHLLRSRIERILGRARHAWEGLASAAALAVRADNRRLEVEIAARRGRLLLETGHGREAELELREARWQAGEIEDPAGRTTAELFLGVCLAEQKLPEGAQLLERVRRELGRLGLRRLQALAEALVSRAALMRGELAVSQTHLELAQSKLELYGAELQDRIVIEGSAAIVAEATGRRSEARSLERRMVQRIRTEVARIGDPALRKGLRQSAGAGVRAAFSLEGPIYPHLPGAWPVAWPEPEGSGLGPD